MAIQQQDTVFIETGPTHDPTRKHLHIALTGSVQCREGTILLEKILLAPIESVLMDSAKRYTCLLTRGEHPFIRHDSFVNYRHILFNNIAEIQQGITQGTHLMDQPINDRVFKKIIQGFLNSTLFSQQHIYRRVYQGFVDSAVVLC